MKCCFKGCGYNSIIIVSILGILFGYCIRHKRHIDKIIGRVTNHKLFNKLE